MTQHIGFIMKVFALLCTILLPFVAHAHFKLSDFEGSYTTYSSSAGGITVPNANNASETVIAQLSFDKHGNGKINFLSTSIYSTPDTLTSTNLSNLPITLTLTDHCLGVGKFVVVGNPGPGLTTEFDFIATKSLTRGRNRGRVNSMLLNLVNITNPDGSQAVIPNTRLVVVQRQ